MSNKKIQEERKKRYFIDAAKELIEKEGIKNITVKRIASKAGFASGTLYNYFDNLNILLIYCVIDYFEACYETLSAIKPTSESIKDYLMRLIESYSKFFMSHQNIYELIFLQNLGTIPASFGGENFRPKIIQLLKATLIKFFKEKNETVSEDQLEIIGRMITNSIHGNLLFYVNQKHVLTSEDVIERIREEVLLVLEGR